MARKAKDYATWGQPADHGHDYSEIKHSCKNWAEVLELVRQLYRRNQAQFIRIVSVANVRTMSIPRPQPITADLFTRTKRVLETQHSRAREFRILSHQAPEVTGADNQTAPVCLTIAWSARGEDMAILMDAIYA